MRLIKIVQLPDAGTTGRIVKIKYDGGTEEYVCQLFISGAHYEPADYFTTDNEDAFETAKRMCEREKVAARFLSDFKAAGYSSATMRDAANARCVSKGEQSDIYHWKFSDGSMLYYNAGRDGWTV